MGSFAGFCITIGMLQCQSQSEKHAPNYSQQNLVRWKGKVNMICFNLNWPLAQFPFTLCG